MSIAITLSTSSLAATQEPGTNASDQRDATATEPSDSRHSVGTEHACTDAPNNVGQAAVENAQRSNPNAPVDLQGSRGQTNPSTERAESAQIAQSEDNCVDGHEEPTHENTNEQNAPASNGAQQ